MKPYKKQPMDLENALDSLRSHGVVLESWAMIIGFLDPLKLLTTHRITVIIHQAALVLDGHHRASHCETKLDLPGFSGTALLKCNQSFSARHAAGDQTSAPLVPLAHLPRFDAGVFQHKIGRWNLGMELKFHKFYQSCTSFKPCK